MNTKIKKIISEFKVEWILIINIVIIICSCISAVLIVIYDFRIDEELVILSIHITPILVAVAALLSCMIIIFFRKRIDKLFKAIQSIADGDLVIAVEANQNDACDVAYKNLSLVAKELLGSKQEMQQFTNEFLHEFKTPIAAINGFAEYLINTGEDIETPERMKYLQIIADESIRLSDLSQKNLMLAKVDACQIVTNKTEYNLSEQIRHCTILLMSEIEKKHIALELDMEDIIYYGNSELMEQIWLNLLSNAIKFTPEYGEITIKGAVDKTGITLLFSDTGSGMDEETQKHIFEKYYQGVSDRQKGGNGIGLSIVHRIVTLCGGTIKVNSKENVGSTFIVFLPQ